MNVILLLLVAAFGQVSAAPTSALPAGDAEFRASVHALKEFDIPIYAEVDGSISRMTAVEGQSVKKGELLAAIDERRALAAVEAAQLALDAARTKAEDDIEERYATKAAEVAKADYQSDLQANAGGAHVVAEIQIKKKRLDWERAVLQIEKASKDQILAGKEADVKGAELKAAQIALDQRRILAPWDGEVQTLLRHASEWVNPGDPVLHLVRYDVLQVDIPVPSNQYDPADLYGKPVTVRVNLARDRQAAVQGRVVHVDQSVIEGGDFGRYMVRAEFQNQREGNFWLVRPGLPATVTIHTSQPAVESAEQTAAAEKR
jgi:multidrug resistance efflux pump